jgi:hypothetical protein
MKRTTEKKEIIFKNPRTDERFVCEDTTKTTNIDGVEFILVRKENKPQKHLMRKDSLVQVKK